MYTTQTARIVVALLLNAALHSLALATPAEDQYSLAANYYSQNRWSESADAFRDFLKEFPNHSRATLAKFYMGESLVQSKQYIDAHRVFVDFLKESPNHRFSPQALFRSGETAYVIGKPDEAQVALNRFYKLYPKDPLCEYALPYLGAITLRKGNPEGASVLYQEAIKHHPNGQHADACRLGLARAFEALNRSTEAEQQYRSLIDRTNSSLADDARLQLGLMLYNQGSFDKSIELLKDFHDRYPNSPLMIHAQYWLGMSYLKSENWPAAARTLEQAIKAGTNEKLAPAIHFAAGEAYRNQGDVKSARSHYQRIIDDWPTSEWGDDSLEILVRIALELGEHASVDPLADAFGEKYPQSTLLQSVSQLRGRSLIKRKMYIEATAIFENLISTDSDKSNHAQLRYLLALSHIGTRRFDDALKSLETVQTTSEQKDLAASVLMARATALVSTKKYSEAIEVFRQYIADHPDGPETAKCRSDLTVTLAELGKFGESLAAYRDYAEHHANDAQKLPTAHFVAERAYEQKSFNVARELFDELALDGNPKQFVEKGLYGLACLKSDSDKPGTTNETFDKLVENFPNSQLAAEAAVMRAQSLVKAGKTDEAIAAYEQIFTKFPKSEHAPDAMLTAARMHAEKPTAADKNEAASLYQQIVADYVGHKHVAQALYELAWTYTDLNRDDDATKAFERLYEQYRDSVFWGDVTYRLAEIAAGNKDHNRAKQLAQELIEARVDGELLSHALYLHGQMSADEGAWKEVSTVMQQIVENHPQSALMLPASYWVAESLYRQKQFKPALEEFNSLAEKTKERNENWLVMVPLRRAQILAKQKQWQRAYDIAHSIAERFPNFQQQYEADYVIGRSLASRGQLAEARDAYERVVRSPHGGRTETAAMAQWMIGETFFHQKNYDDAIKSYHRVETLYGFPLWQAGALLQAAKCYERKGDWQTAIKMYAQLMKDYPNTTFTQEASKRLRYARDKLSSRASANRR